MKVDTIVEMENGENFYIADETVQNGVKYYLANKVDENDEPTTDTKIFKETLDGNDIYLDVVKDESELNYLGAIFLANFSNDLEEEAYDPPKIKMLQCPSCHHIDMAIHFKSVEGDSEMKAETNEVEDEDIS